MTERFDARINLLAEAPRPLKFRDPVHLHMGTAKVTARIALLDRDEMKPGESVLAQVHLDSPLVAHRQDRFIIRSYSPMTTIGGGQIIDPAPKKHKRFRDDVMQALKELESGEGSFIVQKLAELGCVKLKELEQASGLGRERVSALLDSLSAADQVRRIGDQWVTSETARAWQRVMIDAVDNHHRDHALQPGMPHATLKAALPTKVAPKAFEELLAELIDDGQLAQRGEWIARSDFSPKPTDIQEQLLKNLEKVYRDAGVEAKGRVDMLALARTPDNQVDSLLAFLFANGTLVRLNEDSFMHKEAYQKALHALKEHFAGEQTLTLAEFRNRIGSARKQTQAILELFDSLKYTMRKGDERVAWQLPNHGTRDE
jgi:selenocysteine-specific elongation factor